MLKNSRFEIYKQTNESPTSVFEQDMLSELIELDVKLYSIKELFKPNAIFTTTLKEASYLKKQKESMEEYYWALLRRCEIHKLIYILPSAENCCCRSEESL